jgi:hypothetical protein
MSIDVQTRRFTNILSASKMKEQHRKHMKTMSDRLVQFFLKK